MAFLFLLQLSKVIEVLIQYQMVKPGIFEPVLPYDVNESIRNIHIYCKIFVNKTITEKYSLNMIYYGMN